jgi:4-amino-4-deoxy-L-arabinose transferase-like glycosyltransferase
MKRAFWYTVLALAVGAALRLFFVLKFPGNSGDTVIYDQLAGNWLAHGKYAMDVSGAPLSVDIRMPGYPAYLALVSLLTRQAPENAHRAAMIGQIFVDFGTCLVVAALAVLLLRTWVPQLSVPGSPARGRVYFAALWLAVLCPFTANYVAVPLTETWAIFFTALASLVIVPLLIAAHGPWLFPDERWHAQRWNIFLAGLLIGLGTLFRPEAPLLLATALLVLAFFLLRARKTWRFVKISLWLLLGAAVPLVPWMVRNAVTLHEFQPLTPKDANLPGELVPKGFMAWEATWLYRVRDNYLVPWKLNDEEINVDDIPASAFDTPEERERISAALEAYNQDLTLTPEEDAVFAQVARERTARYPLRTYLWIPVQRSVRIWFTPRIELLPVSGHVFPLAYMYQEDPVDQRTTVLLFILNLIYVALGLCGGWLLWQRTALRAPLVFLVLYIFLRTAFLTTLETPEPRYVLVCFPALIALAAQLFGPRPARS